MNQPQEKKNGFLLVLEGINGCGKRQSIKAIDKHLENEGLKGFDLVEYWLEEKDFPNPEDLVEFDYFLSAEPTHAWVGATIRKEMFYLNGRDYDEISMLNAYALDRHILYKRLLVPLRKMGKMILQERTMSSTLAIQTAGDTAVGWDEVLSHQDHQYVLANLPDLMLIVETDPEVASGFINGRSEKDNDHDKYETLERQRKTTEVYASQEFRQVFESRNVIVDQIVNDSSLDVLRERTIEKFNQYRAVR